MTFPNNCSFLRLSEGRLRQHLSKLLCRLFSIKFSSRELYIVIHDAWGKDSGGGGTPACVCVSLWSGAQVSVLPWQQHLVEPCADSANGTGLQELLPQQLHSSNFVAWLQLWAEVVVAHSFMKAVLCGFEVFWVPQLQKSELSKSPPSLTSDLARQRCALFVH